MRRALGPSGPEPEPSPLPPARGAGPLPARNFRLFLCGYACSLIGSGMTLVVLSFALLRRFGGGAASAGDRTGAGAGRAAVRGPLRDGAALWGGLLSMLGAGSALGGLLALRVRPSWPIRTALLAFLAYALLPLSLAFDPGYRVRTVCFLIGGLSFSLLVVLWEMTLLVLSFRSIRDIAG